MVRYLRTWPIITGLGLLVSVLACRAHVAPVSNTLGAALPARVQTSRLENGLIEVAIERGSIDSRITKKVGDWGSVVSVRIQECSPVAPDFWKTLGTARQLRKLELIHVPVADDELSMLRECRDLEELLLAHTHVRGDGLRHLAAVGLKKLSFHSRQATGEGLRSIESLTELRELELNCPESQLAALPHLKALAHLEKLTAHGTPLGPEGIQVLKDHAALKMVWIDARGLEDRHVPALNTLQHLEDLTLAWAAVSDAGLAQLKLPHLRRLFLDTCANVTDAGLYHLSGVPELEELLLMGSSVGGEDLMGLVHSGLVKLRRVFISANQFRGDRRAIELLREKLPQCEVIILQG